MDYEKKYKDALEKAKGIINYYKEHNRGDEAAIEDLEEIFPELTMRKDEIMRMALVKYFDDMRKDGICANGIHPSDIIEWLKRQKRDERTTDNGMDYEQRYKEALEKIRDGLQPLSDGTKISGVTRAFLEEVFPELQESEDERIRKALVRFHKSTIDLDGIKGEDIIAWLEKQSNKSNIFEWHSVSEEPEEMKELFCEWESDDATWHDVAFYDEESHTFRHAKKPINVTKWVYVDELLEKQGQKSTLSDEDKMMLNELIIGFYGYRDQYPNFWKLRTDEIIEWLKKKKNERTTDNR